MITVALLTSGALLSHSRTKIPDEKDTSGGLRAHPRSFAAAALIAGVAPLFGFTAIAIGLVGYVTALFKLSAVLTVLWARLFLCEGELHQRLLGAVVMTVGGVLVAV